MSGVRLLISLLLAVLATSVQAETINCTPITSLPAVISTQGVYCLTGNLATSQTSGNAITITANNVTLDLNGWKIGGQAAGTATQAFGIYSAAVNVTVKNGIVRGFRDGIILEGRGAVVRDMLIDQNTTVGILVDGSGAVIDHNQVVDTGGSTVAPNLAAFGIFAGYGSVGATFSNNMVSGLTATGAGNEFGIYLVGANSTVRDNVVSDTAKPTGGGTSFGIQEAYSTAVNNSVSNFDYGIYTAGIYAHNTVYNCTTPYYGGTAGADNSSCCENTDGDLSLNGDDDVAVHQLTSNPPASPLDVSRFTIEAWIYPVADNDMIVAADSAYYLMVKPQPLRVEFAVATSTGFPAWSSFSGTTHPLALNQWNHVVGMVDSSTKQLRIAVNGELSGILTMGGTVDTSFPQTFSLGNSYPQILGDYPFIGRIDEVRLSSVIRYSSDFTPSSSLAADGSALGLWHFDEAPGSTSFADSSGHGDTLTGLGGAATIAGTSP